MKLAPGKRFSTIFNNTWTLTEVLFSALVGDEAFYRPPYHGLRHPLIFYYVHPAVLYVNKFRLAGLLSHPIDPYIESLFEMGVDEMSWDDMSKNEIEWPSIDDAQHYRQQVYDLVRSLIETHPGLADGHQAILQNNPLWSLFMGFEHERIHLETSSVLMRELPLRLVARPAEWPEDARNHDFANLKPASKLVNYPKNSLVDIAGSTVQFGKSTDWPTYGWDNEYGSRTVHLSNFSASEFLVSNGEFSQFVLDGGYRRQECWTETGWSWRSFRDLSAPTFWVPNNETENDQYKLRTCFELIPMQWDWPVIVNYHEAKAFCIWKSQQDKKSYQLITEAQHQALRQVCEFKNATKEQLMLPEPLNTNLRHGSESPVDKLRNASDAKICDLFGNVWQWSEDPFYPLDGAQVHEYYADFSTPCYDGRHQMIFGGSFVSTGDEATPWARFHFRPHFFQHAGFRLIHVDEKNSES